MSGRFLPETPETSGLSAFMSLATLRNGNFLPESTAAGRVPGKAGSEIRERTKIYTVF
jgi:hypothetical protein